MAGLSKKSFYKIEEHSVQHLAKEKGLENTDWNSVEKLRETTWEMIEQMNSNPM